MVSFTLATRESEESEREQSLMNQYSAYSSTSSKNAGTAGHSSSPLTGQFGIPINGRYIQLPSSSSSDEQPYHHRKVSSPKQRNKPTTFKLAQRVKQVSRRAKRRLWDSNEVYDEAAQSAVDIYEATYHNTRSFFIQSFTTAKHVYRTTKDGVQKIEHALLVPVRDAIILPAFSGIERAVDSTVGFLQSPQAAGMASSSLNVIRHTPLIGEHVLAPMILNTVHAIQSTWHVIQYPIIPSRDAVRSTVDGLMTGTKYFLVNSCKEIYFYTKLVDASITRALSHTQWRVLGYGPYSSLNDVHKQEVMDHLCERYLACQDEISRYELACHVKFHNWKLYHDLVVTGLLYERTRERGNSDSNGDDVWLCEYPDYIADAATEAMLLDDSCQHVQPLWFYLPNRNGKVPNKGTPWVLFHERDWKRLETGFRANISEVTYCESDIGVGVVENDTVGSEDIDTQEYPTIAQWYKPNLKRDVLVDNKRFVVSFHPHYSSSSLYDNGGNCVQSDSNGGNACCLDNRFSHLHFPKEIIMRPTLWRFHGRGNQVRRGVWLLDTQKHGLQPYCEQSASLLEDAYLYLKWRAKKCNAGQSSAGSSDMNDDMDTILLTVQVMFGDESQLVQFRSLTRITAIQKTVAGGFALFKRRVFRGIRTDIIEKTFLDCNKNDQASSTYTPSGDLMSCVNLAAPITLIDSSYRQDTSSDSCVPVSDSENIDHLVLVVHGIGEMLKTGDLRLPLPSLTSSIIDCCDSLRKNISEISKDDFGVNVEFVPIEWHEPFALQSRRAQKTENEQELATIGDISLATIPHLRNFANDTMLDILYFMSPRHHDIMVDIVAQQLNLVVQKYRSLYHFQGNISILSHSLGSVIAWDILSHQKKVQRIVSDIDNGIIAKPNAYFLTTPETNYKYPVLNFEVENCFMIGSPVAVFLMMRNQNYNLSNRIRLPGVCRFFNIFHPYDPVAYRLEPLLNRKNASIEPKIIPHWKFGFRVQYQTKYFLQKLMDEAERVKENAVNAVEERIRGIGFLDDSLDDDTDMDFSDVSESHEDNESSTSANDSFDGRRLDFMLQERELETANEYIAALAAHSSYWESKDLALFIAKQIWPECGNQTHIV